MRNPIVQVIDESNKKIVYTLRINGTSFRPKVFKKGKYTVKVGELGTDKMKTLEGIRSLPPDKTKKIRVRLLLLVRKYKLTKFCKQRAHQRAFALVSIR